MDIRILRYFLTVAKEQNFTKAAEQLNITHPTRSRQLAALEEELGTYELKKQNEIVEREFQKIAPYHLNNQEIRNQLYEDGLDKHSFIGRLEHVVKPVYESAQMLGFKEWIYDGGISI